MDKIGALKKHERNSRDDRINIYYNGLAASFICHPIIIQR